MFTPEELAAEHARAMRIVRAVLGACDARTTTARAARTEGFGRGDAPWVLSVGKAAIGMAEGLTDVCGAPQRHLIVTTDGPAAGSLANVLRSDHPLPTQRSLEAGSAVRQFIEDAKAARAPSLTVLISGGASSLICEPIPGLDLSEYRAVVGSLLRQGVDIASMNTVRRAVDALKGGRLAALAGGIPLELFAMSDVCGNALHDIGSGPFVASPTVADDAAAVLERWAINEEVPSAMVALSCQPRPQVPSPLRRAVVVCDNAAAAVAAAAAARAEGLEVAATRGGIDEPAEEFYHSIVHVVRDLSPGKAVVYGGEWNVGDVSRRGLGGRAQSMAARFLPLVTQTHQRLCVLVFATDGLDGTAPLRRPVSAGAFIWGRVYVLPSNLVRVLAGAPTESPVGLIDQGVHEKHDADVARADWLIKNSYHVFAGRDASPRPGEPAAHVFTGPTGTNVNDILVAWNASKHHD
jgi:hydroxypyruvate reductase